MKAQFLILSLLAAFGVSCASVHSKGPSQNRFAFEQKDDRVVIKYGDRLLADYVFKDAQTLRPYFAQVHTLDGIQVTRNFPPIAGQDPVDHPTMHPGIWMAFGDISGQDFWRNKATIHHVRFTQEPRVKRGALTFATESSLLDTNNLVMARLDSDYTVLPAPNGYFLVWHAAFTPGVDGLTFGDQEEMGFGVRMATPIAEKNGGKVANSDGVAGAKANWGKIAAWSDYSGVLSNRQVGVASFPAPKNFRPSWFHNRDYGLMVANAFGQKAFTKTGEKSQVPVAKGETFHLRWAAYVHSTATNEPVDIAAAYGQFLKLKGNH